LKDDDFEDQDHEDHEDHEDGELMSYKMGIERGNTMKYRG
jgi:hypothetical protein